MGHGEEGEGEHQGGGYVLDGDVGRAGENLVAGDKLGMGEVDGEMGVGVVAGGVLSAVQIHNGVADFFHPRTVQESVALLGDDT